MNRKCFRKEKSLHSSTDALETQLSDANSHVVKGLFFFYHGIPIADYLLGLVNVQKL